MLAFTGYTPTELLHKGASTVVYRGHRDADQARVIIKSLWNDFPTALDRAKLRHEHAVLSELQGPGVVAVYPLTTSGNRVALVMEDVGLRSLEHLLGTPLELGLTLRVVMAVTAILRRAHQYGIVHKDIKPHNILVGTDPLRVYVIDWGIASRLGEIHKSQDGTQPPEEGTLAYISPEQTGMIDRPIGPRSDLYSLGVTFYELLTGALPFTDESPLALVRSHLTRSPAPPRDINPRVPAQVSEIVMRLLAKGAEERYASARGLEIDLQECLEQWEREGQIGAFPLGRYDRSGEFRLPQRLYGREADVAAVMSAFQRVEGGAAELFLVTGYTGIGKSAIVRETRGPMRLRGARVIAGKFDQFRDAAPYASLVQAFRELTRQLLTEPAEVLFDFRQKLLDALGQNGGVLTQLIPEFERILGPQAPVAPLEPSEAESLFHLLMQRFVSVFACEGHALVLFLDDMQWAEPGSLKLIDRLLTDPERGHLLVIGAYRDQDEDRRQVLTRAFTDIAEAGGTVSRITLQPLAPADADRLIADALHTTVLEVEALGAELYGKTHGNPFFLGQLLTSLVQDGLISFDDDGGVWRWDLPAIAQRTVTDNVAELMAQRLRRLAPATQDLLKWAACLGTEFDHDTLSHIADQSTSACAHGLWPALREGLLVPLDDDYRLLRDVEDAPEPPAGGVREEALASRVMYRFLHDRVQEGAYSLLDEGERPGVHLKIARLLRARCAGVVPEESLFTIVDHLNVGRPLIEDRAERLDAAELDLRAGRRAKASVAYAAARSYLASGIAYLPEDAWDAAYDLSFALHSAHAESVFLCGDSPGAAKLFDELLKVARSPMREVDIHVLRMRLYRTAFDFGESVRIGRIALSTLGVTLPDTEEACQTALNLELPALLERLRGRTMEDLLNAPPLTDPRMKAELRLLVLMDNSSVGAGYPKLSSVVTSRQVLLSLERGPCELSALGYTSCTQMLLRRFGRIAEADLMHRLGVAVSERFPCPEYAGKLSFLHGNSVAMISPAHEAAACYDRAAQLSLQHGDLSSYQLNSTSSVVYGILGGSEELDSLKARIELLKTMAQRTRSEILLMFIQIYLQAIASLRGLTTGPFSLDDDNFNEESFLRRAKEKKVELAIGLIWFYKLMILSLHGEHEAVIPLMEEAAAREACLNQVHFGRISFYFCLNLCAVLERGSAAGAENQSRLLEEHHRRLGGYRKICDEAWRCHDLLVSAERARLARRDIDAQGLYDQAIALARQDGLTQLIALGSELYGRFGVKNGLLTLARVCLRDAHQGWLSWGARAKADALAAEFPQYIAPLAPEEPSGRTTSRGTATIALQGVLFDLGEAMRAARAISSQVVEERVVEQFLRASCACAAAQRAFVVLVSGDELSIAGRWTAEREAPRMRPGAPLATVELCESVVRYVARSHEAVVLNGEDGGSLFADDPYLREHHPKSLLCLPLIQQDRMLGMWYAESNAAGELRRGTVELLQLLAGHAASALENARLYTQLEAAGKDLSHANQKLRLELDERVRVERDRSELQERVIQMQEEMLLELSNPLIPISDRVIVMPVIGTIGDKRAGHMVETVLSGVHKRRARALIIDLTGLRQVDDASVRILLRLAGALRMLGVEVVLTGVRPDVARTIIGLGVDMSEIVVCSTLQAGIAFAMVGRGHA